MSNSFNQYDQTSHLTVTNDTSWQPEKTDDLAAAIGRIERELPGWWWSVGACHVSSDASCGPDRYGPAADLLKHEKFDEGFHNDLRQPSTCAQALNACIDEALEALAELRSTSSTVELPAHNGTDPVQLRGGAP